MNKSTFNAIGGWQPFLFCAGMYIVALFFSIFVCSSIFYAFNAKSSAKAAEKTAMVAAAKQNLVAVNP